MIKDLLGTYRRTLETDRRFLLEQYQYADMARKVVGAGSVASAHADQNERDHKALIDALLAWAPRYATPVSGSAGWFPRFPSRCPLYTRWH